MRRYIASLDRVRKAILGAGGLAAAVLAILALSAQLRNNGDDDKLEIAGRIESVEVEQPNVMRREYCEDHQPDTDECLANGAPSDRGHLFVVKVILTGQQSPCCQLKYTLREVENDDALSNFRDVPAATNIGRSRNVSVWVPYPRIGNFYATFELEDEDGTPLDDERSPPFSPLTS